MVSVSSLQVIVPTGVTQREKLGHFKNQYWCTELFVMRCAHQTINDAAKTVFEKVHLVTRYDGTQWMAPTLMRLWRAILWSGNPPNTQAASSPNTKGRVNGHTNGVSSSNGNGGLKAPHALTLQDNLVLFVSKHSLF